MLKALQNNDHQSIPGEEHYREIIDSLLDLVCRYTPDGRLTFANEAFCRHFSKSSQDLMGANYLELLSEKRRAEVQKNIQALNPEDPFITSGVASQAPGEKDRWYRWTDQGIFNDEGQLIELQSIGYNLPDDRVLEAAATHSDRVLSALHIATSLLSSALDLETLLGQILDAAISAIPAAEKGLLYLIARDTGQLEIRAVLGYAESDPRIQKIADPGSVVSYVAKAVWECTPQRIDDLQSYSAETEASPSEEPAGSAIAAPLVFNSHVLGALTLESPQQAAFSDSDLRLLVNFAATATAGIHNAQLHAEVQQMAITDALTGLYNRRGFFELGEREVERSIRFGRPLAAIFIDVDHLKQINDTHGHEAGDKVLQFMAHQIQNCTRKVDIVSRYGGDEFALLLPENDLFGASLVAERLRDYIAKTPIKVNEDSFQVSVSIGVVKVSPDVMDLGELINRADQALYAAKQAGRNRIEIR